MHPNPFVVRAAAQTLSTQASAPPGSEPTILLPRHLTTPEQ